MSEIAESHNSNTIVCKVNKVIFHDDKTGRTIMSVNQADGSNGRVLGKIKSVDANWVLKGTGLWKKDAKYGWQFEADSLQVVSTDPMNEESEYLECVVREVRVLKAESGFASAKADGNDGSSLKLSGRLAKVRQGSTIGVYGKLKHDERYGDEFVVSLWE